MKNRIVLIFCICISALEMHGQNLVPNGNFEDTLWCGDSTQVFPKFWYSPTSGTPDYFYQYGGGGACPAPSNLGYWTGHMYPSGWGFQLPHTGVAYAGLRTESGNTYEYIAVQLTDTLHANKKYCIDAFVSLANVSSSGIDLLQFSFDQNKITKYDSTGGQYWYFDTAPPDGGNQAGNFLMDTLNWMHIHDTLIAQGGERYMIIGLLDSANIQDQYVDTTSPGIYSYYYFDDISVVMCGNPDNIDENAIINSFSLTPNPSNGEFLLKGNFPANSKLEIFDMLGQGVSEEAIEEGSHAVPIKLNLPPAVYIYQVKSSATAVLKTGKLLISE